MPKLAVLIHGLKSTVKFREEEKSSICVYAICMCVPTTLTCITSLWTQSWDRRFQCLDSLVASPSSCVTLAHCLSWHLWTFSTCSQLSLCIYIFKYIKCLHTHTQTFITHLLLIFSLPLSAGRCLQVGCPILPISFPCCLHMLYTTLHLWVLLTCAEFLLFLVCLGCPALRGVLWEAGGFAKCVAASFQPNAWPQI